MNDSTIALCVLSGIVIGFMLGAIGADSTVQRNVKEAIECMKVAPQADCYFIVTGNKQIN